MRVLFNIVAVLVWQITSLARPGTWLAKAKDLTFDLRDQGQGKDNNTAKQVWWIQRMISITDDKYQQQTL